jgi:phage gp36-like protein
MALRLLVTRPQLEARVSARVVQQVLDDNNDGQPDGDPVDAILRDASSYVLEAYYNVFGQVPEEIPPALTRLALDAAQAYLAIRHPEYVRYDGYKMLERIDKELDRLAQAKRVVGETPPDPAANQGGRLVPSINSGKAKPSFAFKKGDFGIF